MPSHMGTTSDVDDEPLRREAHAAGERTTRKKMVEQDRTDLSEWVTLDRGFAIDSGLRAVSLLDG